MKTSTLLALLPTALIALSSCKKENVETGVTYNLSTRDRSSTTALVASTTGTVTWTSGFANAKEIEFEAEKQNVEIEFKSNTPTKIDLFAPKATLGFISLQPGTYEEVEFEVHLVSTATEPSLELKGTFDAIPVIFKVENSLNIEAENEDVTIINGNEFDANISLSLSTLTRGITDSDFRNATRTNGTIILSKDSNKSIYDKIISNIKDCDDVEIDD